MENSTLDRYIADVEQNHRIMSNEDQARLVAAYRAGDKIAYDALVNSLLPLVLSVVSRMVRRRQAYGAEYDDMVQAGNVALLQAIESWNPEHDRSLPSWAMTYIRREVAREGRRSELVKPTVGEKAYYEDLGHARKVGDGTGQVDDEGDWAMMVLGEFDYDLVGDNSDDSPDVEHDVFMSQMWDYVAKMDDIDAKILEMYYKEGMAITHIADEIGVSRQTVHTRINKALDKLSAYIT